MLAGVRSEWKRLFPYRPDFQVYYTAAYLVRSNESIHLYDDAERNVNRSLASASYSSFFATSARAHGFRDIELYTYPPTLADLLTPLTLFSPFSAAAIWQILNLAALLSSTFLVIQMLGEWSLGHASLVAAFSLIFRPTLTCFNWGQVTFILLFLVTAGLSMYFQDRKGAAGFLFALAITIKLTPLIVIVPLIAWRDWKFLRAIALWGAIILSVLLIVNGWGTLTYYVLHVVPRLSDGAVDIDNRTVGTLFAELRNGFAYDTPSSGLVWAERLVSVSVICYAGWLSRPDRKDKTNNKSKLEIIAIFLLISCCLAPVSWVSSYVLSIPALVMVGHRIWAHRTVTAETTLLLLFLLSLSLSTEKIAHFLVLTPLFGVALGLMRLHRLQFE